MIGIAEHEALAWKRLSALRAWHILPPQFTGPAANAISNIDLVNVIFEGIAPRTDSKSKLLFTAFTAKLIKAFEDSLMFIKNILPTTDTADELECVLASDAGYIGAHSVVALLLVKELQAILLGAAEVVHGTVAVCAGNDLPEVWLV
jgi:hypothetical protein